MNESMRERVLRLIAEMKKNTVSNGCTPGEAAKFAARVAELIEKYQIDEAELLAKNGKDAEPIQVCEKNIRTGKKVFNPGMTAIVSGLTRGMCCRLILLSGNEATYGIIGDALDADYICQMAPLIVQSLQLMARLEGAEHGYSKAGLVRWSNQYLMGAGEEIKKRIEQDRKERSEVKQKQELQQRLIAAGNKERVENLPGNVLDELLNALRDGTFDQIVAHGPIPAGNTCSALVLVTGEMMAVAKREAAEAEFSRRYPKTKSIRSRSSYDSTARKRGEEAGKRVGLHVQIGQ